MGEGDGDVGEDGVAVGEVRGDDDAPWQRSGATGSKGERSPIFFFFLDLLPRWEKGFPSGPWLPWRGSGESPSEIGSVSLSLSVSAFLDSALSPFLLYPEIRNSNWGESFAQIFLIKLAFLRQKKSINRLTGCPEGPGRACPPGVRPLPRGPRGHRIALILLPRCHKYSKNILRSFLSRLDSV